MSRRRWTLLFLGLVFAAGTVVPAAAQSINPVTTAVVASTATAIPGGTGNFTNFVPGSPVGGVPGPVFPPVPAISAGNVVFWGAGSNGQQGIYAIEAGVLMKVADLETPIPAGTGDFTNFIPGNPTGGVPGGPFWPPNPVISGPFVAFAGSGISGQAGIYVGYPPNPLWPPSPVKVADLATAIPGNPIDGIPGTPPNPYFTSFLNPALSGLNAAFIGFGANGWQGVYIAIPNGPIGGVPPDPIKIADLATPIPDGVGNFTGFALIPSNPRVNGQTVAFIGLGSEGQQGIYVAWPPSPFLPPSPIKVADTTTLIPGDSLGRTFAGFSDIAWPPTPIRTPTLAFVGSAAPSSVPGVPPSPGLQGVYTVTFPSGGVYPPTPIKMVADLTTAVPGGGAFMQFGSVSVSGSGAVVFDAWYSSGGVLLHGLFTNINGTLMKVLDNTESVAGKPLADFSFGSGGFGGARAAVTALFQDGSQGMATLRVSSLTCYQSKEPWACGPLLRITDLVEGPVPFPVNLCPAPTPNTVTAYTDEPMPAPVGSLAVIAGPSPTTPVGYAGTFRITCVGGGDVTSPEGFPEYAFQYTAPIAGLPPQTSLDGVFALP